MAQRLNRLTISAIFEKDKQGNYTSDAQLRQDILLYYQAINNTTLSNNPFTLRDLQNWIVQNNKEIRERYVGFDAHTPIRSRRYPHATRIEGKFNELIQLQLIRKSMREKLYSTDSPYAEKVLYEYTRGGIFLALIIGSARAKDKATENIRNLEKVHQNIYYCLVNLVFKINENSLASNIFYSNMFKKCKDKGVFDKFVDCVHHIINNTQNRNTSILNLFGHTVNFAFFNNEKPKATLTNILIETIEELEQKDQKLILNRLKMLAEEDYENSQEDLTREYEEFRFELRNNYEHVAIQGYCENCRIKQNVKPHYLDLKKISTSGDIRVGCPACKSSRSVLITNFYY